MTGDERKFWQRSRVLLWVVPVVAAIAGIVDFAANWKQLESGPPAPPQVEQGPGGSADINREASVGTVQTLGGKVSQDFSKNVILYNNAFRVEVVRATDDASTENQRLRDDILSVLDGLLGAEPSGKLSADTARAMGQRLGAILDAVPISSYQLKGREFTLKPGNAWFLPNSDDSIAFVGPSENGDVNAITIRRNGRSSTMAVGATREFRQGAGTCRLLLHAIAADHASATFSYTCHS
ncbi:MAG: hypothetical protein IPK66_00410 [Rhodospirillales bacterium]|nr:hypothetical protein [Rhodospirillales bacterium]